MNLKTPLRIVSMTLIFLHVINLWFLGVLINLETVLMIVGMLCSIGLFFGKEWARKFFIANALAGFVYYALNKLFLHPAVDVITILIAMAWLTAIVFYTIPLIKKIYQQDLWKKLKTILVIDDDKTILKLMRNIFIREGLSVLTAATGERGLAMAVRHKPDLIILDVILPAMNGLDVCAKLKEDSQTREIPIMFLTVKDSPLDIKSELEFGGVAHMTKPVDSREIFLMVKKMLGIF